MDCLIKVIKWIEDLSMIFVEMRNKKTHSRMQDTVNSQKLPTPKIVFEANSIQISPLESSTWGPLYKNYLKSLLNGPLLR